MSNTKGIFIFLVVIAIVNTTTVRGITQEPFFQPVFFGTAAATTSSCETPPPANRAGRIVYEQKSVRPSYGPQPFAPHWYVGAFGGGIFSGSVLYDIDFGTDQLVGEQIGGVTGGINFGYAFYERLGLETRYHFSYVEFEVPRHGRWVQTNVWTSDYLVEGYRTMHIFDVALHYAPFGEFMRRNAKWQPYIKGGLGLGWQNLEFRDFEFREFRDSNSSSAIFTVPIGCGVRYWRNERIGIQAEIVDNIIFGTSIGGHKLKTTHNFALTLGVIYSWR